MIIRLVLGAYSCNGNFDISVMISQSIFDTLKSIFTVAMASAFPDLFTPEAKLQPVQEKMAKFGDYMCVSTMDIAKLLKGKAKTSFALEDLQDFIALST